MREIKFRVWLYIDKKMQHEDLFGVEKFGGRDCQIMQFTGLKDKNGTDIYEGDIIGKAGDWKIIGEKTKNFTGKEQERYIAGYELKTVKWQDDLTGFYPFANSPENCLHCGGADKPSEFEVIGNIFENTELLNQ